MNADFRDALGILAVVFGALALIKFLADGFGKR
jgi:hypothetical protein